MGVSTLLAWNMDVARDSLAHMHRTARNILQQWAGYLVLAEDDGLVAAFNDPSQAIMFSLMLQQMLLTIDW
jgi:class 3 adenylate cyclase